MNKYRVTYTIEDGEFTHQWTRIFYASDTMELPRLISDLHVNRPALEKITVVRAELLASGLVKTESGTWSCPS